MTICGFSAALRSASLTMPVVCESTVARGWLRGRRLNDGNLLHSVDTTVAASLHGRPQRVPRQARALDANRKLTHAGQHGQLAQTVDGSCPPAP